MPRKPTATAKTVARCRIGPIPRGLLAAGLILGGAGCGTTSHPGTESASRVTTRVALPAQHTAAVLGLLLERQHGPGRPASLRTGHSVVSSLGAGGFVHRYHRDQRGTLRAAGDLVLPPPSAGQAPVQRRASAGTPQGPERLRIEVLPLGAAASRVVVTDHRERTDVRAELAEWVEFTARCGRALRDEPAAPPGSTRLRRLAAGMTPATSAATGRMERALAGVRRAATPLPPLGPHPGGDDAKGGLPESPAEAHLVFAEKLRAVDPHDSRSILEAARAAVRCGALRSGRRLLARHGEVAWQDDPVACRQLLRELGEDDESTNGTVLAARSWLLEPRLPSPRPNRGIEAAGERSNRGASGAPGLAAPIR